MATQMFSFCQKINKNTISNYVRLIKTKNNSFLKKKLLNNVEHREIHTGKDSLGLTSNYNRLNNVVNSNYNNNKTNIILTGNCNCGNKKVISFGVENFVRNYSTEAPNPSPSEPPAPKRTLPPLMEYPELIWPSVFKTIRNWILSKLIIAPYFDNEFSLYDFITGSKQAVEVVSHSLSDGNFKNLEGLVDSKTLDTVQKSLSQLSLAQRQQLAITKEDIYFSFPYQVGVMFDEENNIQRRFVEITMVYHVLRGLSMMRERGDEPPINMGMLPEYADNIFICNYRFIREFTKGVNDGWTVNMINHFKPNG